MTFTEEQFERIVREVMRRLGVAVGREANHGRAARDECSSSAVRELRVMDRVVTMRSIEGQLNGVARVVVKRRTVVTPAVKDELKKRKIELVEVPQ
jgi:hypothetical protein